MSEFAYSSKEKVSFSLKTKSNLTFPIRSQTKIANFCRPAIELDRNLKPVSESGIKNSTKFTKNPEFDRSANAENNFDQNSPNQSPVVV